MRLIIVFLIRQYSLHWFPLLGAFRSVFRIRGIPFRLKSWNGFLSSSTGWMRPALLIPVGLALALRLQKKLLNCTTELLRLTVRMNSFDSPSSSPLIVRKSYDFSQEGIIDHEEKTKIRKSLSWYNVDTLKGTSVLRFISGNI